MAKKISRQKRREYTLAYEKKHPFKNKYFKARYRARVRGIEFTVTYEEYRDVLLEAGALGKTGRTKDCLSVDRRWNHLGYVSGNLRVITVSANSSKGCGIPEDEQPDWYKERPTDDCPF